MNVTKGSVLAAPIFEDFVPTSELVSSRDCDTLIIHLPGFKKEQLRVQLIKGILRLSGSMPIGDKKMRHFQKEFQLSPNCDTNKITARFKKTSLNVKPPKLITPKPQLSTTQESKNPQNEAHATKNAGEEVMEKKTSTQNEKNMEKLSRKEGEIEARSTRTENYRKMVGAMGERLKTQRRVMNVVLGAIFSCIVAIYVNSLFTSFSLSKT